MGVDVNQDRVGVNQEGVSCKLKGNLNEKGVDVNQGRGGNFIRNISLVIGLGCAKGIQRVFT